MKVHRKLLPNGYKVEWWYDRYNRSWVTELIDENCHQVLPAEYDGTKAGRDMSIANFSKFREVKCEVCGGSHNTIQCPGPRSTARVSRKAKRERIAKSHENVSPYTTEQLKTAGITDSAKIHEAYEGILKDVREALGADDGESLIEAAHRVMKTNKSLIQQLEAALKRDTTSVAEGVFHS